MFTKLLGTITNAQSFEKVFNFVKSLFVDVTTGRNDVK